jgi:hypothetical protein
MPVSEWPAEDPYPPAPFDTTGADQAPEALTADAALVREAQHLLAELQEATRGLGDAFARAGFAPGAWHSADTHLSALSDQLPTISLEALLTRLGEFAGDMGPAWLADGGEALDEFAHEVTVLLETSRPLRALAQRQRLTPSVARGRLPLERALGDVRVGTQLDRLARTLGQLAEVAELLEPLPAFSPSAPSRHPHGIAALGRRLLWTVWPPRRSRVLALGLVAGLLVVVVSGMLALTHGRPLLPGGAPVLTSAQATATAMLHRGATPSPTPAPIPAHLAVSPASVVLPCSGTSVTLTVSDSGAQALTWHASVSGSAVLSTTSGWVGAHGSGTLSAHASGGQRAQGTITFTSNGGTGAVKYRVSCH